MIIDIVQEVFARYPGCGFFLDELPDLPRFASAAESRGGRAFVAEIDGAVVGCVAIEPCANGWELHRLYVRPAHWGSQIGYALLIAAEDEARRRGATAIELWSDVKFERAHGFYERRGYVRGSHTRKLHDQSDTVEYFFRRGTCSRAAHNDRVAIEEIADATRLYALFSRCVFRRTCRTHRARAGALHDARPPAFEQALASAKQDGKPLLLEFSTTWCGPCKLLARELRKPRARPLLEQVHLVVYNGEEEPGMTLMQKFGIGLSQPGRRRQQRRRGRRKSGYGRWNDFEEWVKSCPNRR